MRRLTRTERQARTREDLLAAAARVVARRGYDAVVAFSDPQAWPVVASMRLDGPRVVPVPCVMPHNEGFLRENLDNLREWRKLLTRVHAPVHSSIGALDARLHRELGIDAEYVPNASEEIRPEGSLRELLGIAPDTPLLLHVSNYSGQKNHLGLLEAIAQHPGEFRLVMVGHPVAGQSKLERDIRRLAAADPRVILAGGLPGELVSAGMREADLLVHPSISEGAPITVLEAMSCGLPVVATDWDGYRDLVAEGETGFLVPLEQEPGSIDPVDPDGFSSAFASRVNELIADPGLAERMGQAGRERALTQFGWQAIAEQTVGVYERLVAGVAR
jgi:glycosyltransferase involved in cell wall biosynthesis